MFGLMLRFLIELSIAITDTSDVVLMKDDLKGLPLAKRIAKKTMGIVFQNIVFSLAVKLTILILSAVGLTNMWIAVIGDVGVGGKQGGLVSGYSGCLCDFARCGFVVARKHYGARSHSVQLHPKRASAT